MSNTVACVHIVDPTCYMNMVRVDPTFDKHTLPQLKGEDIFQLLVDFLLHM